MPVPSQVSGGGEDLTLEASSLLVPAVVSLMNLLVPLVFSLIAKLESYANPRTHIYTGIARSASLYTGFKAASGDNVNRASFLSVITSLPN